MKQKSFDLIWWREFTANVILAVVFATSAIDLWQALIANPRVSIALYFVMITIITVLFLIRTCPEAITVRFTDWVIAFLGTCFALQIEPTSNEDFAPGVFVEILGIIISILGLVSLGRRFSIVPALRGIQSKYIYRYVRHPIYSGYIITFIGLLMNHDSTHNAVVIFTTILLILARIRIEERFLSSYKDYKKYANQTPWRLVPYVW